MMMRSSRALLCTLLFACSRSDVNHAGVHSREPDTVGAHAAVRAIRPSTDTVRQYCPRAGELRVSDDSVGPLELDMNLGSLRAACPGARDTVWYGENDVYPAVVFPFQGLLAVAVQYRDSVLHPNQPADRWFIRGATGLLFGRLPLTTSWAHLRDAFGAGIGDGANGLTVMFCAHERVLFELDASPESVTPDHP